MISPLSLSINSIKSFGREKPIGSLFFVVNLSIIYNTVTFIKYIEIPVFINYINPNKSQIILKILFDKGKEERIGFNELFRKMNDVLYPNKTREDKGDTSKTHFKEIRDRLLSDGLIREEIIKHGNSKNTNLPPKDYFLTEIGELCYKYGYKPEDYKMLYSVCQLISSLATFGMKKQKERKGDSQPGDRIIIDKSNNRMKSYYLEVIEGVSKLDILQHLTNENEGLSSEDKKSMQNAVNECFEILYEKKIITRKFVDDENRYFISPEYKEFLYKCWNGLFDFIYKKIVIKCEYVKTPDTAEIEWYGLHYTKEKIDSFKWDCIQLRKD